QEIRRTDLARQANRLAIMAGQELSAHIRPRPVQLLRPQPPASNLPAPVDRDPRTGPPQLPGGSKARGPATDHRHVQRLTPHGEPRNHRNRLTGGRSASRRNPRSNRSTRPPTRTGTIRWYSQSWQSGTIGSSASISSTVSGRRARTDRSPG